MCQFELYDWKWKKNEWRIREKSRKGRCRKRQRRTKVEGWKTKDMTVMDRNDCLVLMFVYVFSCIFSFSVWLSVQNLSKRPFCPSLILQALAKCPSLGHMPPDKRTPDIYLPSLCGAYVRGRLSWRLSRGTCQVGLTGRAKCPDTVHFSVHCYLLPIVLTFVCVRWTWQVLNVRRDSEMSGTFWTPSGEPRSLCILSPPLSTPSGKSVLKIHHTTRFA